MSQEDVQSAEYSFSRKQIVWGLVAVFAVYGTMAYSVQTLTIARPKIAAALDGLSLYAWSVSIPSLVMALVTIIFGKFSDMYGRRIMLMISLIACFVGTVLSALSPNFIFMIVARSIAALGIGAMMPQVPPPAMTPEKIKRQISQLTYIWITVVAIALVLGIAFVNSIIALPIIVICRAFSSKRKKLKALLKEIEPDAVPRQGIGALPSAEVRW